MELISLSFAVFVAVALGIYYVVPKEKRWIVLLVASYVYYLLICNKYIIYMIITTLSTYAGARAIDRIRENGAQTRKRHKEEWSREERKNFNQRNLAKRRNVMILVLLLNFGILGFLKYFDFAAGIVTSLLGVFGIHASAPNFRFLLPLGISFYTFQTMGYLIDVYQENVEAEKNPARLALFVSFFPQIIQGPIAMYDDLAGQLYEGHDFQYRNIKSGMLLILWGLFKKMVIADRAVKMIDFVTADVSAFSGTFVLAAALMYALQLYADFSGGIDVVRGIGEMFGITMTENFRRPYFAKSLTEYWHRWHITLGNWVRKYVFYPLSISKHFLNMGKWMKPRFGKHISKVVPTSLASMITFLIIGLWHGANSKYVAFGLWNGGVIMLIELFRPLNQKVEGILQVNREGRVYQTVAVLWTFLLVLVGYYFDIAKSFLSAMDMLYRSVFDFHWKDLRDVHALAEAGLDLWDYRIILLGALVLLGVSILQERTQKSLRECLAEKSLKFQWTVILAGIFAVLILGYYGPGVNPADFVYMQF